MSTTQQPVQVDLLGERREATVLEELSERGTFATGPITEFRVDVEGSTFRVDEDDVIRPDSTRREP